MGYRLRKDMCTMDFTGFDAVQKMFALKALKDKAGIYASPQCKLCGAEVESYDLDLTNGILVIEHTDHTKSPCELRFIVNYEWIEV